MTNLIPIGNQTLLNRPEWAWIKDARLIRKLGNLRMLIPEPPAWIEATAWRLSSGGVALTYATKVLALYSKPWNLEILNVTNGWESPFHTINVEKQCGETEDWLKKQTQKLYRFEDRLFGGDDYITLDAAKKMIEGICSDLDIPLPSVDVHPKDSSVCRIQRLGLYGEPIDVQILFQHNTFFRIYRHHVLHEMAHYLEYLNYRTLRHGYGFMKMYASLLSEYGMLKMPHVLFRREGLILD